MRVVGDFTTEFSTALGCGSKEKKQERPLNRVLPRVMIDGPFGSSSEDFYKYEVALLVGAGIGVTPFASILKSIWYRVNYPNEAKATKLSKVYL